MRYRVVTAMFTLVILLLAAPASSAQTHPHPHCAPQEAPTFMHGLKSLSELLGNSTGVPLECEHTNPDNGDTLQLTTKGLAYWRKHTNTPTFTNGWDHWALTERGLVHWAGESIDPPTTLESNGLPPRDPFLRAGVIVEVERGDRVRVQIEDGELETVRLVGIEATGTPGDDSAGCYVSEATARAQALLPLGKPVLLEIDPTLGDRTPQGQLLAHVLLPGDENVAEQLLREGLARVAADQGPYRHLGVFLAAQESARAAGQGLWGACLNLPQGGVGLSGPGPGQIPAAEDVVRVARAAAAQASPAQWLSSVFQPGMALPGVVAVLGLTAGVVGLRRIRRRRY